MSTRNRPRRRRVAGALSLALWVGVIVSGRMIAYNWFDCDRQPQPDIINLPHQLCTDRIGAPMNLLPFFQWCYDTPIGETIRNSTWLFPVIETFHLLGLGLTAGAVLIVDLRLLGVGLSRTPVAQLAAAARPWLIGGVILMFALGYSLVPLGIDQVFV